MWKSVPVLVSLREDIVKYLDTILEEGGEDDYVTFDYIVRSYPSSSSHHPDQVIDAIKDTMKKGRLITRIVFSEGDKEAPLCMSCGNPDKRGYLNAFQYVKRRDKTICRYNCGCGCGC